MTGNDLKKLRLARKETQPEFAKLLGYAHAQRVLEYEKRGNRIIPKRLAERIKWLGLNKSKI